MATFNPIYRLYVFEENGLARNANDTVDLAGSTVLTPRAGASHSDPLQVATASGVAGFQPYLQLPRGRRGRVDPLTRKTDTGSMTFTILDARVTQGGSNDDRWLSQFLSDDAGADPLLGLFVHVEESTNNGSTWSAFYTGRVWDVRLVGKTQVELVVRDLAEDLNRRVFEAEPHSSVSYHVPASLLPAGTTRSYGDVSIVSRLTMTVEELAGPNSVGLRLDKSDRRQRAIITQALVDAGNAWGTNRETNRAIARDLRVDLQIFTGVRAGESGHFYVPIHGEAYTEHGPFTTTGPDENGHYFLELLPIYPVETTDPDHLTIPPVGESVAVYILGEQKGQAERPRPLLLDDVHPVQLWSDMADGLFGFLDPSDRSVTWTIPKNQTTFDDLINDDTFPLSRWTLEEGEEFKEFSAKIICRAYNLAYRLDAHGRMAAIDMRLPSSLAGLPTVTSADLVDDPGTLGWQHSLANAITRIDATYYTEREVSVGELSAQSAKYPTVPSHRVVSQDQLLIFPDVGPSEAPERKYEIDGKGHRAFVQEDGDQGSRRIDEIQRQLRGLVDSMRGPFGGGLVTTTLPLRRTANTNGIVEGDWFILNLDELPNPSTGLRGGARLVRCLARREEGVSLVLEAMDAGPNTTATAPTLGIASVSVENDGEVVVDVPVTFNGDGDPVRVEFALTDTAIMTRPVEGSSLWQFAETVSSSPAQIRNLPRGQRVWIRGRSVVQSGEVKLPSGWVFPSNDSVDTTVPSAPTGLTVSDITASTAEVAWTVGEPDMQVEVLLDADGGGKNLHATLEAGSEFIKLWELDDTVTTYTVYVRHRDREGGRSAEVSDSWSPGLTNPTAPEMRGMGILVGEVQ